LLNAETPFPNVGSYALTVDPLSGLHAAQVELVRILGVRTGSLAELGITEHVVECLVSFPLRDGASGTRTVPFDKLIDATPLTGREGKEMVDLARELRGPKVRARANKKLRHDALKQRAIWAPHLRLLLVEAARREARRRAA
jgi:hypothetical protein